MVAALNPRQLTSEPCSRHLGNLRVVPTTTRLGSAAAYGARKMGVRGGPIITLLGIRPASLAYGGLLSRVDRTSEGERRTAAFDPKRTVRFARLEFLWAERNPNLAQRRVQSVAYNLVKA